MLLLHLAELFPWGVTHSWRVEAVVSSWKKEAMVKVFHVPERPQLCCTWTWTPLPRDDLKLTAPVNTRQETAAAPDADFNRNTAESQREELLVLIK